MNYCVYCDESCHLENDKINIMLFGAIWFPEGKKEEITQRIKDIKNKYSIGTTLELKWTKLSKAKQECYEELINYFFDDDDINFRCLVARGKDNFNSVAYHHDFDTFYHKCYYFMLNNILSKVNCYKIYLDIKDTQSSSKVEKLKLVLSNSQYDYNKNMITTLQTIRSHEVQSMQLTDILLGAIGYKLRDLNHSIAKNSIISIIEKRSGLCWGKSSYQKENKFNIFYQDLKEHSNDNDLL